MVLTEVILPTRGHMPLNIIMHIGALFLTTQKMVKYLGVKLDCRLTYWAQIEQAANKATIVAGVEYRRPNAE